MKLRSIQATLRTIPISSYIVYTLIIIGFIYRWIGIQKGLSFWNDEDQVALMSRGILQYGAPVTDIHVGNGIYQLFYYYVTALSFFFFGVNEVAGRVTSVIAGSLLIYVIFYVTKKAIGNKEAVVAAFITTFSQLQLAWSTQLRPYIWLEIFTLFIIYFSYRSLQSKKVIERYSIYAFLLTLIATLFHGTGLINVSIIGIVLLFKILKHKKYLYLLLLIPLASLVPLVMVFSHVNVMRLIFSFDFRLTHYIHFLGKNYIWLFWGSLIGSYILFIKNRTFLFIIATTIFIVFAAAIFKINSQYVRYSLPAFPLLYILFATGIVGLYRTTITDRNIKGIFCLIILLSLVLVPFISKKIVIKPLYYYSINADTRENPIVDYKLAFQKIADLIDGKQNIILMDAWNDRIPYYLPHQPFIELIANHEGIDPVYGGSVVHSISEFEVAKKKYHAGVVIVENWESLTPADLQNHIRRTLKHEFDVNNLPYNEDDKWSISVYSWGL